jgi:hypothetical protein
LADISAVTVAPSFLLGDWEEAVGRAGPAGVSTVAFLSPFDPGAAGDTVEAGGPVGRDQDVVFVSL